MFPKADVGRAFEFKMGSETWEVHFTKVVILYWKRNFLFSRKHLRLIALYEQLRVTPCLGKVENTQKNVNSQWDDIVIQ